MIYSKRIIELRDEKNLSQKEIAKYLEIDNSLYAKYEKEYEIIPIKHLNALCSYFDVSLDYLFEFTNEKAYQNQNEEINISKMVTHLKELRKDNKITQEKLSKELNIARSALANYERGRNVIATPFLYTICKKYHISADYLLGKIDKIKIPISSK